VRRCEPANGKRPSGGSTEMANLLKRLWTEEDGQGLVEYTLIVLLVALFFWLGVKETGVGASLADHWAKVLDCLKSPLACSA
jgi:Flp pilus assembly pilin Flp